jgi:hypothetical protein
MTNAPQRRKASLGSVAGAAFALSAVWLSCQPGELPCESSPQWQMVCNERSGGTGGTGGSTPMGGSGGAGPATAIANCSKWPTVGEMDKFFGSRCSAGTACHVMAMARAWSDFQTAEVWKRLLDKNPITSCNGGKLINSTDWQASVIWAKVQPGAAACPPGVSGSAGVTMPPQSTFEPKLEPVSDEERTCLEGYLRALSGQ